MNPSGEVQTLFDFTRSGARPWLPVDDVVMGGRSHSAMVIEHRRAVFAGTLSLEGGGGFASVRCLPGHWDLKSYTGIELTLRGDGRRYKLRIRNDSASDGINWEAAFATKVGTRQNVRFLFSDLKPVYRGILVPGAAPFDPGRITTFGFLISDKQAGPFRLEVELITAYR